MPFKVYFGDNTSFKAKINKNELKKDTKHEVIRPINKSKNTESSISVEITYGLLMFQQISRNML